MSDQSQPAEADVSVEPDRAASDAAMEHIRQALSGLRYGEVSVIVQDGVVIQVERTERKRLRRGER
jgi:hypothetical protein